MVNFFTQNVRKCEFAKRSWVASERKEKDMGYRYYSTQRPVMPGSYPKPERNKVEEIVNFDTRKYVNEIQREAWGYIEYEKPLVYFDIIENELVAMKTQTLHLKYLGRDSWSRPVYKDENGRIWKNTDCCSPREAVEARGTGLHSSSGNEFDGEPDCHMSLHISVEYVKEEK